MAVRNRFQSVQSDVSNLKLAEVLSTQRHVHVRASGSKTGLSYCNIVLRVGEEVKA